ncbi:MAG: hypothetical protein C3F13_06695 [Anaerolineales bacterium]|nr:hypothetical protein [Anaerolineae bacterium]PWB54437.1 MAG: hypothetical protein C3F13_06695 [Anaerolineales bacterium]
MNDALQISRYGFYYFPDTIHYRENDLHRWIPELKALGASWLTLLAPFDRAIPETFILQILYEGIQPIIHLPLATSGNHNIDELSMIFEAYAHWGVRYITLFDRPNLKNHWSSSSWVQRSIVERFLDMFIPVARAALQAGLAPSFPALEPGGDYWDTAFLFSSLQGLSRRGETELLDEITLSAYAWPGNRSPDWGAGGPERWPQTRPYSTPANSEDQLGFRIFDWYLAVSQAALDKNFPIILLGAGSRLGDQPDPRSPAVDILAHSWQNLALVRIMAGQAQEFDPVPSEVLACNFWLVAADQDSPEVKDAWFKPGGEQLPVVTMIKEWVANGGVDPAATNKQRVAAKLASPESRPIAHYLLLPTFEWGPADWHLDAIRPFINKYQPTIGFSPVEASHARRVTVVGGAAKVPESIIDGLLAAGCIVEQISGDGMNIATESTSAH